MCRAQILPQFALEMARLFKISNSKFGFSKLIQILSFNDLTNFFSQYFFKFFLYPFCFLSPVWIAIPNWNFLFPKLDQLKTPRKFHFDIWTFLDRKNLSNCDCQFLTASLLSGSSRYFSCCCPCIFLLLSLHFPNISHF